MEGRGRPRRVHVVPHLHFAATQPSATVPLAGPVAARPALPLLLRRVLPLCISVGLACPEYPGDPGPLTAPTAVSAPGGAQALFYPLSPPQQLLPSMWDPTPVFLGLSVPQDL